MCASPPRRIERAVASGGLRITALGALIALSHVGCDRHGPRTTHEFASAERPVRYLGAGALEWSSPGPPGFPRGARIAVLQGDPGSDGPYTIRASLPDGYRFPAQRHARDQEVTVISGTFLFAEGERFNAVLLRAHEAGDFLSVPGGRPHYGGAEGETVVQLHGIGPLATTVVDPFLPHFRKE